MDLGIYGTCTVLSVTPGPYGVQMFELRCEHGGQKTTPGDVFKVSDQEVIREHTTAAQRAVDQKYYQFCGKVKSDIAHLGPAAWQSFLDWLRAVDVTSLLPSASGAEPRRELGEFYRLHERTIAGFTAQRSLDDRPTFSVIHRREGAIVTDTIPEAEIRVLARDICDRSAGDAPWDQYRRLVAEDVEFLVGATRRILTFTIARQERWVRTGDVADLQRLTSSHESLLATAQCAATTVRALLANIGIITVGSRELDVQEFFTGSDFECVQITTALVRAIEVSGYASLDRMTIAARNALREAADTALNKDMPPYLRRPISDARFRKCLTTAAERAAFPKRDRTNVASAWAEERGWLQGVVRSHRWNIHAAAATIHVTPHFLREHLDRHDLGEQLRSERDECILDTYREAAPSAFETRMIVHRGVKAVADAFAIDISDGEDLGPLGRAERMVKEAFLCVDAKRTFPERTVRAAIVRNHGDRTRTARKLGVRIAYLHKLLDVYELWNLVWIHGSAGTIRGDVWRQNNPGAQPKIKLDAARK